MGRVTTNTVRSALCTIHFVHCTATCPGDTWSKKVSPRAFLLQMCDFHQEMQVLLET